MPITVSVSSSQVAFVNRALSQCGKDIAVGARKEIKAIGELVAGDAETLALTTISHMRRSPAWADMRVGQNAKLVYVVPSQRGIKTGRRRRPNLAPLMLQRAMLPAKQHNQQEIKRRFDTLVDTVVHSFNNG